MLKKIILINVLFALSLSILHSQPKLHVVGGTRLDFGNILTGATVKRLVTLKNEGNEELTIKNVSAACGCTGTLLSNDRIAPGDSGILEITFDARKFSGLVTKAVTFHTNDPQQKDVRIVFSATINKIIEVEPEYLYFGSIGIDSVARRELKLKNVSTDTIQIINIKSDPPIVHTSVTTKVILPGETLSVQCEFQPQKAGTQKGDFIITTDHPNLPTISLRFYGHGRGVDTKSLKTD